MDAYDDIRGEVAKLEAVNLAWGRVSTVSDLSQHPALRRIGGETENGPFTIAVPPLHPDLESRRVPALGEHTEQIKAEFA